MANRAGHHTLAAWALVASVGLWAPCALSDVVRDGTVGPPATVQPEGPSFSIPETMGRLAGPNLFHSFSQFNLSSSESATFTGPAGIDNVISRVTGGSASTIDGLLASAIPTADLFFLNPSGVMFGPNAQIHVDGSFHVSTADALHFENGDVFFADPAAGSTFSSAPPSAFGFLGPDFAGIEVSGGFLIPAFGNLALGGDATLSVVGGDGGGTETFERGVVLDDVVLSDASTRRLNLVSVASPGQVPLADLYLESFQRLGRVAVTGGTLVDASEVFIRSGRLEIKDAVVSPGALALLGAGPDPNGGEVNVLARESLRISAQTSVFGLSPGIFTFSNFAGGNVPAINIEAGEVTISGSVDPATGNSFTAAILSQRFGPGASGGVSLTADSLEVRDGGQVSTGNFFVGPGIDLTVQTHHILLSGDGNPAFTGLTTQSSDFTFSFVTDAGDLTVIADYLEVRRGAEITTDSFAFGPGGLLSITAREIFLSRDGANKGGITSQSVIAGDSGDILIDAQRLDIRDGFQISATTAGLGDAGKIILNVSEAIHIAGDNSGVFGAARALRQEDLDAQAQRLGFRDFGALLPALGIASFEQLVAVLGIDSQPGEGGSLAISTPVLTMAGESRIDASTTGDGAAGNVSVDAYRVSLEAGAQIRSRSGGRLISTGELVVGSGDGGSVVVNAADKITVFGQSGDDSPSAISTTTFGPGDGGAVILSAGQSVEIGDGGEVTADSLGGTGRTGDINITSGQDIVLLNGALVSTQATVSDGGNIKLTAPNIIRLDGSEISTSVESGVGAGGNIDLDPQFITLNKSQIIANAFGGPGGNINLTATEGIIISNDSIVSASSALSTEGTIEFDSPDTDVAASIAVLPESFLDASGALRSGCEAQRVAGGANSLAVAGRGSLPVHPDAYLPSFGIEGPAGEAPTGLAPGDGQVSGGGAMISLAAIGCMM